VGETDRDGERELRGLSSVREGRQVSVWKMTLGGEQQVLAEDAWEGLKPRVQLLLLGACLECRNGLTSFPHKLSASPHLFQATVSPESHTSCQLGHSALVPAASKPCSSV
jgi:hypothetical protein